MTPSVFDTPDALFDAAADHIRARLAAAQSARGEASLVLAGGDTPAAVYRRLGERLGPVDPRRVHFFWGDERWVPLEHPARNEGLARRTLLVPWAVPEKNIHPLLDQLDDLHAAARRAHDRLLSVSAFDLLLLGVGEDGHTASLFPGSTIDESALVAPIDNAPKPPPERLTMTPACLSRAREILILATGLAKTTVLQALRSGKTSLPVSPWLERPNTRLFVDRAAWGPDDLPPDVNKF